MSPRVQILSYMQFSAKILGSQPHFGSWCPPQENPASTTGDSNEPPMINLLCLEKRKDQQSLVYVELWKLGAFTDGKEITTILNLRKHKRR